MSVKYGPHTSEIEAIIEAVKGITSEDVDVVEKIYWKLDMKSLDEAFNKAQDVLGDDYAVPDLPYLPYKLKLHEPKAGWKFTALSEIFYDAILAILARDCIGTEFTQEQHDLLMKPWNEFMEQRRTTGEKLLHAIFGAQDESTEGILT